MTLQSAFPVPSMHNSMASLGHWKRSRNGLAEQNVEVVLTIQRGRNRVRSAGRWGCHPRHDVTPLMWHLSFQPPSIQ